MSTSALEDVVSTPAPVEPGDGVALVDASGKPLVAPPSQAIAAIKSGSATFAKGQRVGIRDEGGRIRVVTPEEAMSHVAQGGELAGRAATAAHARRERYGDAGGMVAAGGEALVRGATLGLSDRAALAAAHVYGGDEAEAATREHLEAEQAENPYLSTGAELAGTVLPGLLTGGASEGVEGASLAARAARGVGAPARLMSGVGDAAGGLARAVLPEAEGFGGRLVTRGLEHAATGAAEGAGYGVAQQLDESALNGGDHELTAEQLLAAAGHGALAGGVLGGAVGSGLEAASEGVSRLASKAADSLGDGSLKGFLDDLAKKHAFKSIGTDLADTRYANARIKGGPAAVSDFVLDELPKAAGKPLESMTLKDLNEGASKLKAEAFEELDHSLDAFDAADPSARPKAQAIISKLDEVANDVRGKVGQEGLAGHLDAVTASIEKRLGIVKAADPSLQEMVDRTVNSNKTVGFRELRNIRAELDDLINKGKSGGLATSPLQKELGKFRWAIEDEMLDAAEKAGGERGAAMRENYLKAKQQAHLARFVEDTTADKLQRVEQTNGAIGLRSSMMAAGGLATGHPLGAAVAGLGSQAMIGRGDQVIAGLANRAAHLGAIQRASEGVENVIGSAVRGFVSRTAEKIGVPLTVRGWKGRSDRSLSEGYDRQAKAIRESAANPEKRADILGSRVGSLALHAPTVAGVLASKQAAVQSYLESKLPPASPSPSSLQPFLKGPPPSEGQMAAFLRVSAVAKSPLSLLGELHSGRVTQDQVDTVKALYPRLYEQIQQTTMEAIAQRKDPLPYEKRKTLGILLSIPTDPILDPSVVSTMQASYSPLDDGEAHHPPGGPPKGHGKAPKINVAGATTGDLDAAIGRERGA